MSVTVTAAEIARLAGVGRAAVSNWRRRHGDFPKPVGGTDTSPEFDLAEVEAWLRANGKLRQVPEEERVWHQLTGLQGDRPLADTVGLAGALLLYLRRHGGEPGAGGERWAGLFPERDGAQARQVRAALAAFAGTAAPGLGIPPDQLRGIRAELARALARLAAERGPSALYERFLERLAEASWRSAATTPWRLAALMAELAGPPAGTVLDPACGTGTLLAAALDAAGGKVRPVGQEADRAVARLAALRLALRAPAGGPGAGEVRVGDSLRGDAFAGLLADAVLCHPPFGERNWGYEELAYDPRWEYGAPPRSEPELAWVQHALAHLRPGGTAVLLLPPPVASRRSGRRVRAELLRRGALRAVVALPPGAAPPPTLSLQLWILRRPEPEGPPPSHLLLVDAAAAPSWAAARGLALRAWRAFARAPGAAGAVPGAVRAVPVIDLLDEEVDLTPARHLAGAPDASAGEAAVQLRERLAGLLAGLPELLPEVRAAPGAAAPALVTVGELARVGALTLHANPPARQPGGEPGGGGAPLLTARDVIEGRPPSERAAAGSLAGLARVQPGDVLVPAAAHRVVARVATEAEAGAVLGPHLHLLRPDPGALDPWFVAGFLRSPSNQRAASTLSSLARLDVRRCKLPRLPLAEQRRYADAFRRLEAFEAALRRAAALGDEIARAVVEGLAAGTLQPGGPAVPPPR
ncbi:MAG TPA: N-6 DNA methylase [Gemmataceae bacterium]